MPRRRQVLSLAGTALATAVAGCSELGGDATDAPPDTGGAETATPTPVDGGEPGIAEESRYTEVYREHIDSVVLIRNPNGSLGSGWVFDDGIVVTNAHVVGSADRVRVSFGQGDSRVGEVLGRDSPSDLAAVGVDDDPDYAAPFALAESEPVIGTNVAVLGTPFGLRGSLSSGVVSGRNRLIPNPRANFVLPNAIQTDAPVNPGNSGGPLVDLDGTVLGVVNSGRGDNIAFAISPSMVRRVVPALVENGSYDHPSVGARLRQVTPSVATAYGLEEPRGLVVTAIAEGSPADGTLQSPDSSTVVDGFRIPTGGDIVLAVGETRVATRQEFLSHLFLERSPGETVDFRIRRDGEERTVPITLGTYPVE